jgi:hypothetical protein
MRHVETGLMLLAAVAVMVFIFVGVGRPIWADEANAVLISNHGFHGLVDALQRDNNLPVYYVLLSLWIRWFGESEPALRALSVVFYLGGAGVVSLLALTIYRNRRTACYAGLLYLSSSQLIHQAQAVRMYTLLGLLSAASLLLWVRIFVQENRSRWLAAGYVVLNCIGMLTQVWFSFMLFGQFLYLIFRLRSGLKKFAVSMTLSALVFSVLWGPTFASQLHNGSTRWLPPFHPIFLLDIVSEFYGAQGMGLLVVLACSAPLLMVARPVRRAFCRDRATSIVLVTFLACTLVPLAVSMVKPIYTTGRYSTVALPALAVLLAAFLTRLASRTYAAGICFAILVLTAVPHVRDRNVAAAGLAPGQSDRATAEYILQQAGTGDYVVFTNLTRTAADYYFRRAGAAGRFVEASFPNEMDQHAGWVDPRSMDPQALAIEAEELTERLKAATLMGKTVWVYDGLPGVSEVLNSRLDSSLTLAERYDLRGPYHWELLRYR